MDQRPTVPINNHPIGLKPREFFVGIAIAAAIVFAVAGTRWLVRARTIDNQSTCRANLHQIEGAVGHWASEHQKAGEDTPAWTDLVGPKAYIAVMPVCPEGGAYTLAPVGGSPRCSIPDHVLP
jgi:hypothetical protein